MTSGRHSAWQEKDKGSGSGEPPRRRGSPSRGFVIGMGAVILFALFLVAVGAIAAGSSADRGGETPPPLPVQSPIPVEITVVPPEITPDPDYTQLLP